MEGGIPVFDGEGYEIWKKKMKTMFLSLELWDIVQQGYEEEGKVGENNSEMLKELEKKDNRALFLIQQGISNKIFPVIKEADSSKEAWNAIRNKFDVEENQFKIEIAEILPKDEVVSNVADITQDKCIFRVPDELRNGNEEFYEPKVIAIGPYHRGKQCLAAMEDQKKFYQKELLQRITCNENLESLVQAVKQHEQRVRKCYDESNITNLNSDELAQMMVLDGCFIIELFCRYIERKVGDQIHDPIITSKIKLIALQNDMLLIENQIPFFILQILFNKIFPTPSDNLIFITLLFFGKKLKKYVLGMIYAYRRFFREDIIDSKNVHHLLHITHKFLTSHFSPATSQRKAQINPFINSATKLKDANVKLKTNYSTMSMFDITFKRGKLNIPCWNIDNQSELEFRNLIAFEVCQQLPEERFFIDYVFFMDHLVGTSDDVNLLISHGIFINHMINASVVDTMLRNLTKNVGALNTYNYYKISKDLNMYCNRPWNKWIVNLKQKHFKTPWTIVSLIAGFVLLCLTAIQTVFTVKK